MPIDPEKMGALMSLLKKKILILMMEVGMGHKIPALAIKEELERKYPDRFDISVLDFARECGALGVDRQLKKGWDIALSFPFSVRIGYRFIELIKNNFFYIELLCRDFIKKGMDYIANTKPDAVLATHALCLYIACKARRTFGGNYKVLCCVVDPFDGYSLWANLDTDLFFVATEQSKKRLIDHGVNASKILVTGFPMRKSFFVFMKNKDNIVHELGLDPAKCTILISAGSRGISNVYSFAECVKKKGIPFNIISVAGKNQQLKEHLDTLASIKNETNLVSLGYVDTMNELMAASDVIAGKAGASTFMEALFMKKPMIFTGWTAYNDWYIIDFALKHNIGWYCPTLRSFLTIISKLSSEPHMVHEYSERIEALHFTSGTETIADIVACEFGNERL